MTSKRPDAASDEPCPECGEPPLRFHKAECEWRWRTTPIPPTEALRLVLDVDRYDAEELIRYLEGDHHMGVYDRSKIVTQLRRQMAATTEEHNHDT